MVVMKASEQTKPRGDNSRKNGNKAILVAQEISFAKVLAGNDKKLRDRGVKRLRKWLSARSNSEPALEKEDFMRLWKGLFYCMWMADKPLVQEELAETISSLVHSFNVPAPAVKFIETFFRTISLEWQGIDQHRLEKFLMFVRRFLRQSLVLVERQNWDLQLTDSLCKAFEATLLHDHANLVKSRAPLGLVLHFAEIFLEELAKVSKGKLNEAALLRILKSFAEHIAAVRDARIRIHITRHIFIKLIEQSPVGLEFQEKFRAWQALGFPGGSIDMMERADEDSDEASDKESEDGLMEYSDDSANGEGPLDPRAGAVDVELPIISFNATSVSKLLEEFRFKKYTNAKTRKHIADLISKFEELATGECPIGMKKVPNAPVVKVKQLAQEAAEDLTDYQSELLENYDSEDEGLYEKLQNFGDSDEEDQSKVRENSADSEEDALKENEDVSKKTKKLSKQKTSRLLEKTSKKKKASSEVQSDKCDEVASKVAKKSRVGRTKLKRKAISDIIVSDAAAASEIDSKVKIVDPDQILDEFESKAQDKSFNDATMTQKMGTGALLQHIAPHLTGLNKPKRRASCGADFKVQELTNDELNVTPKTGTGALLQHIAPHVTESNKSKRRASCGAKLQVTVEDDVKQVSDSPSTSQGKEMKKRKSMWDEPLQEGEYEIFIPKEEIVARKKRLSDANSSVGTPKVKNPFASPAHGTKLITPGSSSKKVNFVLQRNKAQAESEYLRTLRENPEIPYDANKEPPRGVLKPSPYSSPVNPFYKRKLHI